MPITALDPVTALVVIDLQTGVVALDVAHPVQDVIDRSVSLISAFRDHALPVVLVNVDATPVGRTDLGPGGRVFEKGWTELIPELGQRETDILITKHSKSAFSETGLVDRLRDLGVTQVVVVGVATSSGVESTARDAHELGFSVTLPVDAMTDSRASAHDYSIATVFPRIAETGTTADVLALLARA